MDQLTDILKKFINELEVSFDLKLDKVLVNVNTESIYMCLKEYQDSFEEYNTNKNKKGKKNYDFLNHVKLSFGNGHEIDFGLFSNENKNTKKTIIDYLYNIFICSSVDQQVPQIFEKLSNLLDKNTDKNILDKFNNNKSLPNVISELMNNKEIKNIAEELAESFSNTDPTKLMSSLLSGKPDANLTNIINKVSNCLENKFSSGKLDKKKLEEQFKQLINLN